MSGEDAITALIGLSELELRFGEAKLTSGAMEIPADATTSMPRLCPVCGSVLHGLGRRPVKIRTWPLDPSRPKCALLIFRSRAECPNCGKTVTQPLPSCVKEHHRVTKAFAQKIGELAADEPFKTIQTKFQINDATVKRLFTNFAESIVSKYNFVLPAIMGIDEVMTDGTFRTTITNLERGCLFDILEYRKQSFLEETFAKYPLEQREAVKWVCSDIYRPFKKPIGDLLPNARWVIDRFYVVMKANEAVDQMRIRLQAQLPPEVRLTLKKRIRFSLLRRPRNIKPQEREILKILRIACPELMRGYDLKEGFYAIYEESFTQEDAKARFEKWKKTVPTDDNFKEFQALIKTFENFQDNILNFFDSGGLTNAQTECVNGLIRITNRLGRGYDFKTQRLKMLCRRQAVINAMRNDVEYGVNIATLVDSVGQSDALDEDELMMTSINLDYEKRRQNFVETADAFAELEVLEDELTEVK